MVHQYINAIISAVKVEYPDLKECRYYKGEFEEGSEWNPVFPIVLVNCSQILPSVESQKGWKRGKITLNVYVGIKMEQSAQQTFFELFIPFITSLEIGADKISATVANLVGYYNGVEAYKFEVAIETEF